MLTHILLRGSIFNTTRRPHRSTRNDIWPYTIAYDGGCTHWATHPCEGAHAPNSNPSLQKALRASTVGRALRTESSARVQAAEREERFETAVGLLLGIPRAQIGVVPAGRAHQLHLLGVVLVVLALRVHRFDHVLGRFLHLRWVERLDEHGSAWRLRRLRHILLRRSCFRLDGSAQCAS